MLVKEGLREVGFEGFVELRSKREEGIEMRGDGEAFTGDGVEDSSGDG